MLSVRNLTPQPMQVYAAMDSTDEMLRIGEKGKGAQVQPGTSVDLGFEVISIKSGIFEFPPVKAWANNEEVQVAVGNFWVHVE